MIVVYTSVGFFCLLFAFYLQKMPEKPKRRLFRRFYSETVTTDLKRLSAEAGFEKRLNLFYEKKVKTVLTVITAACVIAVLAEGKGRSGGELQNGSLIKRDAYDGEAKTVTLLATNALTGEQEKLSLEVEEQKYSDEALAMMLEKLEAEIPAALLLENPSPDHVTRALSFPKTLPGYPFALSYRTDHPTILSAAGVVNEANLLKLSDAEEGIVVKVIVTARYDSFSGELTFYVRVYPMDRTDEESFFDSLRAEIALKAEESKSEAYMMLPTTLGDTPVSYREADAHEGIFIFLLGLVMAFLLYKKEDEALKNRSRDRDRQMLSDYPMIVNKFALFYSIGMTTRGIFLKLCKDYESKKEREKKKETRYVYEEMLKTRCRLEEGIGEISAYEDFAMRCKLPKYRQLVNLMEQAVIKGKGDIQRELSGELQSAFLERKNHARALSEEAGTKLLLPMFLMLFVVIIVIMIPAFLSFQV